jgi:urease accessory protein
MATTSTLTDACSISLARTASGRPRVSSYGGPVRVVTLSAGPGGARIALVPTRALLLAGDAVEVDCEVEDGLALHLQETSGTVAYDMRGGSASWSLTARVGVGSRLVVDALPWVSSGGSDVTRTTSIHLQAGATLLARETLVLGRSGEGAGALESRTTITRGACPVVVEELHSAHLAPHRVLDSILAVGVRDQPLPNSPRPLQLETGDRLWRRLGREAHETAAALDPVWTVLHRAVESSAARHAMTKPAAGDGAGRRRGQAFDICTSQPERASLGGQGPDDEDVQRDDGQ